MKRIIVPLAVASPMWANMADRYCAFSEVAEVLVRAVLNKRCNFGSSKQGEESNECKGGRPNVDIARASNNVFFHRKMVIWNSEIVRHDR